MTSTPPAAKKFPWTKLVIVALVLIVVAVLILRGLNVRAYLDQGMTLIRSASPTVFFLSMAFLPMIGAPLMAFVISAGPLWADRMGMGTVLALSLLAITVNFTLSYFLARRALRPLLQRIVVRMGYKLPEVADKDATDLIVIMRVTWGIPYCVQNYLLGLAEVPFGKYFVLTALLSLPQNTAGVLFGEAIMHGRAKTLVIVGGLFVGLMATTHLVRRHYAGRKKAPA